MRVIKDNPVVERKPVTIEFTPQEVDLLYEISRNIGGDPNGPRGFIDTLTSALFDEGATHQGLIDRTFGRGIMLNDSW